MSFIEKLQKYSENKNNKINMADLNAMVAQVNKEIGCGSNCRKDRRSNYLKNKYEKEKIKYNRAPYDLDESRKKYFNYAFGEQYYDDFMRKKANREITALTNKLAQDHQYNMKILEKSIQDYENIQDNAIYINELNEKYEKENGEMKNTITDAQNENNISNRKVDYQTDELDKLKIYNSQLIWLYWTIVLVFLITFFFKNMFMEKKNFIVAAVLLLFPFIIHWIVFIFSNVSSFLYNLVPKNMYIDDPEADN
jgi:hypothetical protein